MTRFDWDRVRRERSVGPDSPRADVQTIRGIPPSDKQVERLRDLGYRGPRPVTTAELRRIREGLKVARTKRPSSAAAVGERELEAIRQLPLDKRAARASELIEELDADYRAETRKLRSKKLKATTRWEREIELAKHYQALRKKVRRAASAKS
jgi:hypothetical protein